MSTVSTLLHSYKNLRIEIPPISEDIFETKPVKPKRCCQDGCKKKLMLTDFACKCGEYHCSAHRIPEAHYCSFDFKENHKENLLKTMSTAVVAKKIDTL
jgi:predicted nucleic acid binding AN1-type Zn finger protein